MARHGTARHGTARHGKSHHVKSCHFMSGKEGVERLGADGFVNLFELALRAREIERRRCLRPIHVGIKFWKFWG